MDTEIAELGWVEGIAFTLAEHHRGSQNDFLQLPRLLWLKVAQVGFLLSGRASAGPDGGREIC